MAEAILQPTGFQSVTQFVAIALAFFAVYLFARTFFNEEASFKAKELLGEAKGKVEKLIEKH